MAGKIDDGGPAFPQLTNTGWARVAADGRAQMDKECTGGMTLRQYAAIKLRVPNSGTGWLDDMIRVSIRDGFADQANEEDIAAHRDYATGGGGRKITRNAAKYRYADAMIAARKEKPHA